MGFDYAPPKYAQVVAEIKSRIERGQYPPGSLLPSEHQLVSDFGVSRPTIVKALSALRQDGWIDTQQGRGSFVRGRPALAGAERTRPAQSVLELPEASLSGELVQAGVKLAPGYVTSAAGPGAGRQGVPAAAAARRRRRAGGAGLGVAADRAGRGTGLASPDLLDESIRHHLQARKKIRFDHAVERISARQPTGEEAGAPAGHGGCPGAERDRHRVRRHGPAAAGGRHRAAR